MPHQTNRPTRPCEPATTKRRGRLACPRSLSQIRQVAAAEPLLFFGFGIDFTTVQEAALKVKEGAWMWTEAMSPGLGLHDTPASYRAGMGCVLVEPAVDDGGRTATLSDVMEVLVSQRLRPAASEPTGNCHCFAASTIAAVHGHFAISSADSQTGETARDGPRHAARPSQSLEKQ